MENGTINISLGENNTDYEIDYDVTRDDNPSPFNDVPNDIDIIGMRYSHSGISLPFDKFMKIIDNDMDTIKFSILCS